MLARDIMTTDVVSVRPNATTAEIARLLTNRGISAVPVVDAEEKPIGMVSEGDLLGRNEDEQRARRDWWLALLAEGEELSPDYLKSFSHSAASRASASLSNRRRTGPISHHREFAARSRFFARLPHAPYRGLTYVKATTSRVWSSDDDNASQWENRHVRRPYVASTNPR